MRPTPGIQRPAQQNQNQPGRPPVPIPGINPIGVDISQQNPQQQGSMGIGLSANQNQIRTSIPGGVMQQQQQPTRFSGGVGVASNSAAQNQQMMAPGGTGGGYQTTPTVATSFGGPVSTLALLLFRRGEERGG